MTSTVLILGASGRFGRNAAAAFERAGWNVRRFRRGQDDLMDAATGADVILHGWNPAYPDWARDVPRQTADVIAAARRHRATVIIPGNIYVYGDGAGEVLGVETPQAATNPLGRIRVEMEAAFRASDVQTIVLRAGDFIDIEGSGNWFDKMLTKDIARGRFIYPGNPEAPHAWAFLPDLAAAAVQLAERRADLDRFEDIPFPGYTLTGRALGEALGRVLGRPVRLTRMNWLPLRLSRPFWPMARCLVEMGYLWSMPHRMDGRRFDALLPEFRSTPLDRALAAAVQSQVDPDHPVARPVAAVDGAA